MVKGKRRHPLIGDPPCMSARRMEILEAYEQAELVCDGPPRYCDVRRFIDGVKGMKGLSSTVIQLHKHGFVERVKCHRDYRYRLVPGALERARAIMGDAPARRILECARELVDDGEFPSAEEISVRTGITETAVGRVRRLLVEAGVWPTRKGVHRGQRQSVAMTRYRMRLAKQQAGEPRRRRASI